MLLGIVLHALLWFIPVAWPIQEPWAYSRPVETNAYAYLLSAIHGFRMPVFFLIGGFFTAMLWQRRGWRGWPPTDSAASDCHSSSAVLPSSP